MTPVSREEIYLTKLAGGSVTVPSPVSRNEMYLAKACGESVTVPDPVSREEMYLYKLAGGSITLPTPVSRLELLMAAACGEAVVPYDPVSRLEWFWRQVSVQTITGVPPLTFISDGTALNSWIIYGNGQQTGTPTPDAPIMPDFVGTLSDADWTIPITCAGQTVPVYLGQTQTVRRVKKLVLTGEENYNLQSINAYGIANFYFYLNTLLQYAICTHLKRQTTIISQTTEEGYLIATSTSTQNASFYMRINSATASTVAELKTYLSAQYAAGTPVCVWYVLATPETAIVNEPLTKIGDYADELHSIDTTVTIQTVSGSNTLTIDTTLQPSSVSITGNISQ